MSMLTKCAAAVVAIAVAMPLAAYAEDYVSVDTNGDNNNTTVNIYHYDAPARTRDPQQIDYERYVQYAPPPPVVLAPYPYFGMRRAFPMFVMRPGPLMRRW